MKIRSAVPDNGCLIFFDGRKKNKKKQKMQNKTSEKHIRIRHLLEGGCIYQYEKHCLSNEYHFNTRPKTC